MLHHKNKLHFQASMESAVSLLRSTKRQLLKDSSKAEAYKTEIQRQTEAETP